MGGGTRAPPVAFAWEEAERVRPRLKGVEQMKNERAPPPPVAFAWEEAERVHPRLRGIERRKKRRSALLRV